MERNDTQRGASSGDYLKQMAGAMEAEHNGCACQATLRPWCGPSGLSRGPHHLLPTITCSVKHLAKDNWTCVTQTFPWKVSPPRWSPHLKNVCRIKM
jgi:hypothetical protein